MNNAQIAVSCFKEGFACSQALLSTYGAELGMDRETAMKVSGAFGGGMGNMGETCGAVTGAFMVIGLKYAKTNATDEQAKEKTHELVREFVTLFKAKNGSILCRELLGHDISTPEGMKIIIRENLFDTVCPDLVRDAAEIIDHIL